VLPYPLDSALQLGSLDSLSGFLRSLPLLNVSTLGAKLHHNCGAEMPACPGHSNRSYTASVERRSRPGWDLPTILQFPLPTILAQSKPSRINTCKSASKQTTSTPFRINTYEKTRGWGEGRHRVCTNNSHSGILRSSLVTRHSSLATILKFFPFKFLRTLLHFFALAKNSTHFFSISSALFVQKHPGWGTAPTLRQGSEVGASPAKEPSRCACQIAGGLLFGVV